MQNNKSSAGVCHDCSCVSNFSEIGSGKIKPSTQNAVLCVYARLCPHRIQNSGKSAGTGAFTSGSCVVSAVGLKVQKFAFK